MDTLSSKQRSERMGLIRGTDTKPELVVRRMIYAMGYRYRLHRRNLPGRPDVALIGRKKAIFVHGCFWHRHPEPDCPLARLPKSRLDFWLPKLEGNRERDEKKQQQLKELGWEVLVVWECQLKDKAPLRTRLKDFLGK